MMMRIVDCLEVNHEPHVKEYWSERFVCGVPFYH